MNQHKKPIIGILTNILTVDTGFLAGKERIYVNRDYVQAITESGGIPLLLPIVHEKEAIYNQIALVDGILISGGQDVDPGRYGEKPIPQLQEVSLQRDHYELEAIRCAYAQRLPILGICRGLQVLNVAFGGTLYQDIRHNFPSSLDHSQKDLLMRHEVILEQKSKLQHILNADHIQTNSLHHQSVKKVALGFVVNARASDADREAFVNEINKFRAEENLPPLQRWTDGEECADRSAMLDSQQGAHASQESNTTCFPGARAWAQNTIPGNYSSLQESLQGVKQMWDEKNNPSRGQIHYENMKNTSYKKVAVGVYKMPNGKYWVNMNFRD